MSIWTREELLDLIAHWKAAYKAVSFGQSYNIDGRSLTYQHVSEIRAQLNFLQRELDALTIGGSGIRRVQCRTVR